MIKELYGSKNQPVSQSVSDGKSVYISSKRYNEIRKHLTRKEDEKREKEQERNFQAHLKDSSRAMTDEWTNTVEAQLARKQEARRKKEADTIREGEQRFKALMAADEQKRSEFIKEIEEVLKKIKIGPRQLESATRMTEVMATQEYQRKLNAEARAMEQKKALSETRDIARQAQEWLDNHRNEILAARKRTDDYKTEIFHSIKENERTRHGELMKTLADEKSYRDTLIKDWDEQAERDRVLEKQKKQLQRDYCAETIKLAKDRDEKFQQQEKVQDKIDELYKESRYELTKKFKAHEKTLLAEKFAKGKERSNKLEQMYAALIPTDESFLKAEAALKQRVLDREQHDINRVQRVRAERLKAHAESLEEERRKRQRELEEKRWDVANRLKNIEVHAEFDKQKRLKEQNKNRELYNNFDKQIRAKQEKKRALREQDITYVKNCTVRAEEDDKYFMNYADELINDAKAKGRKTLPIERAVMAYRKINLLRDENGQDIVPPHLVSHIDIGCQPLN